MAISRRTILKYGLGGAVLLGVGGVGLSLRSSLLVTPARPLRCLSPREFSVLASVAEALLPAGDGFPSAREVEVAEQVDAALAVCHPGVIDELKQVLALLENPVAGLLLDQRPNTFTACSVARRHAVLQSWRCAKLRVLRGAFKALHGFCAASYYSSEAIQPLVGYPGVPAWVEEQRLKEASP